jgi:translation initiation factor IF-2
VIEAQVEAGRGPTATVIVQIGTLKIGDPFICGDYGGKVKSLVDDRGKPIKEAGPSTPVKVLGLPVCRQAGDEFLVMESERSAKTLSEERLLAKRSKNSAHRNAPRSKACSRRPTARSTSASS